MHSDNATVLFAQEGPVATIRFNRPPALNALDQDMAETLLSICKTIRASSEIRVVVISGEGRAFMAGGDLAYFQADIAAAAQSAPKVIEPLHEAISILTQLPQLVVASLHGAVAGAGVSLALACDLSIAAAGTRFNMAYARIGASPDGSASWSLPRTVGLHKALELTLLAETFDAAEALRLGIVNRVVEAEALKSETQALAQRLAAGPTFAYAKTKQLMRTSLQRTLEDQMAAECEAFVACAKTADFVEGVGAFFDKRPARFGL